MRVYIEERILAEARYISSTGATCRKTAKKFGISKSTIHNDMTLKLPQLDKKLYNEVANTLKHNKEERHLRGGLSTKIKYERF